MPTRRFKAMKLNPNVAATPAPKGRKMVAQGNALGSEAQMFTSPVRATQRVSPVCSALSGLTLFWEHDTRGVAPGYHVMAFQASESDASCLVHT